MEQPTQGEVFSKDEVERARRASIPDKSSATYWKYYRDYEAWCIKKGCLGERGQEVSLLMYFTEMSTKYSASTLWTRSSAIKKILTTDADANFTGSIPLSVQALLKSKKRYQKTKQSKGFSKENVVAYLSQTTTNANICQKLALALGVLGALRICELTFLCWESFADVDDDTIVCTFNRAKQETTRIPINKETTSF